MSNDATTRKTPGPMSTFIGKWSEDKKSFAVLAGPFTAAAEKEIKAAVKDLGEGTYDRMTCRTEPITYKKVTRDSIG